MLLSTGEWFSGQLVLTQYTARDKDTMHMHKKGKDTQRVGWVGEGWVRNKLAGARS